MESIAELIDLILHFDNYLGPVIEVYGPWTYVFLFLVIFCETGFVITNFLPGDVLLFTAGAFAAVGTLNIWVLIFVLGFAAIIGDNLSFWWGRILGVKAFLEGSYLHSYKKYLDRAHLFFNEYGAETIVLARFVPMLRSFAPFVAGMSLMRYLKFGVYNFIGVSCWSLIFLLSGFFLGKIPIVKNNLSIIIFIFIFILVFYNLIRIYRENRLS